MLNPKSMKKWKVAEVVVFLVSYESQVVDKSVQSDAKIADSSLTVMMLYFECIDNSIIFDAQKRPLFQHLSASEIRISVEFF